MPPLAALAVFCPSCKDGLAEAGGWALGFNVSILFMMAMPFAIVAVVGGAMWRARRRRPPPEAGGP